MVPGRAADSAKLILNSKSMVAYGENASGKSSFVDGLEYVLTGGRIGHLGHEYSGKRQEKGVINTHTPDGAKTELRIEFQNGSQLVTNIKRNSTHQSSGADDAGIGTWDYRRTVLRQDEVATFIGDTKGGKYSALLPLLGLHQLELAAENLRQLAKAVENEARLGEARGALEELAQKRERAFGVADDDQVLERIGELHRKYCADKASTVDPLARCGELEAALRTMIEQSSPDQRKHLVLRDAADLAIKSDAQEVRSTSLKLAGDIEPLVVEKLGVLASTGAFVDRLSDEEDVKCPACGRPIAVRAFRGHVAAEKERLKQITMAFNARKAAIGTLCGTVRALKSCLDKEEVKSWRAELAEGALASNLTHIEGLDPEALRQSCTEEDLAAIEKELIPLIDAASTATREPPPEVPQLEVDKLAIETGKALIEAKEVAAGAARGEALVLFLSGLESAVREEIRHESQEVINEISSDIRDMWEILHPGSAVENVRLYLPEDADKAIDIGLKFHGVQQESPRLTLSEGNRNSLGLCIFLAMAKREAAQDRPLVLDDVVVSLDRTHRGMIAELLEMKFSRRQVLVLTHDRDWYTELRHQLRGANWAFKALMPYDSPEIGIRWSERTWAFEDARAHLDTAPDVAGNTARKIMDIELATRAQGLKMRLPYLHREKNDHRTAHDFLYRLISDGKKSFKRRLASDYEPFDEAIEAFQEADRLLLSWANRASHSFDVERTEAEKVIAACEKALGFLDCQTCGKPVQKLDDSSAKLVQCQCGHLVWRYGKV